MFSRFFIDRPIFAAVLSVFIVIAGLASMRTLPIAQYPEIAPPVVTVRALYPGASAQILEQTVAAPLENQITGVENMIYMASTSASNGVVQIHVTFDIGTDIDQAALNVINRVKQAEPRLPLEVRRQGVTVEKGSSSFLQVLAFYSPDGRFDDLYTSNYVTLNVLDALKRVPGTTNVQIFGAKDYAMRIWVRPDRLAQLKLTPTDLIRALNEQNAQFAAGKVGQSPSPHAQELVYTITTKGRLAEPREFENIILRANADGSTLRLRDVARVELASKDYEFIGRINGQPATLVGVFLQPGANALEVAADVRGTVAQLSERFPQGLAYAVPYDTTRFVEVSIREVVKTLGEAKKARGSGMSPVARSRSSRSFWPNRAATPARGSRASSLSVRMPIPLNCSEISGPASIASTGSASSGPPRPRASHKAARGVGPEARQASKPRSARPALSRAMSCTAPPNRRKLPSTSSSTACGGSSETLAVNCPAQIAIASSASVSSVGLREAMRSCGASAHTLACPAPGCTPKASATVLQTSTERFSTTAQGRSAASGEARPRNRASRARRGKQSAIHRMDWPRDGNTQGFGKLRPAALEDAHGQLSTLGLQRQAQGRRRGLLRSLGGAE
jgi:hypothetical protein